MLKDEVLKVLSQNRHRSVSGQELATRFGVSRNAVWKSIQALEQSGIPVHAVSGKGYCLAPQALTPYDVQLPQDITLFFYDSTDSTNNCAKRLAAEGFSGKALIVAKEQTGGRGRCGRQFYSPKDTGIYVSYLFHPEQALADAVFITTAAAVAVVRAIEAVSTVKPAIKWVNDIFVDGKKVCGILTEAVSDFESGTVQSVIVGIGINVNTQVFPEQIADTAASLNDAQVTPACLLQALADALIQVESHLQDPSILEEYIRHSLFLGREITFQKNGVPYSGTAIGIRDDGALVVETAQGEQVLSSGEIHVRLNAEQT